MANTIKEMKIEVGGQRDRDDKIESKEISQLQITGHPQVKKAET